MQAALAALALVACGGTAPAADSQSDAQSTAQSGGSTAPSDGKPFTTRVIADFEMPWAMTFLPGSGVPQTRMALITEKNGKLWLVDVANGQKQAVSGVPAVKVAGQGGLGDVVAHPGFAGNQRVYLSFAEAGAGETSGAALGYGTLRLGQGAPRIEGFKVIWRQAPKVTGNGHFAHRIAFAPDGTIFLSSGERQKFDPAQAYDANLGKILHLTAEGQPVPGGPFAERGSVAAQIYSMGHRNNLGLAFGPDRRLWAIEMGPKGGDEFNLVEAGKNYGYPIVSNGSHYDGRDIPDHPTRPEFAAPKLWWNPSISPAGLIIYSGDLFKDWKGDAIFGALSGQALVRADLDGDNARKAEQWPMGARIREVEQGPEGEIYLLEDGEDGSSGRLLRLDPAK
jgi:glucose/arabinose dehydrogenase